MVSIIHGIAWSQGDEAIKSNSNISGGSCEFFKHASLMTEDLLAILVAQIGASVPAQRV